MWNFGEITRAYLRLNPSNLLQRKISIFFLKVSDEDEILPPKLQAALMQILEERNEILTQEQNFSQGMRQVSQGLKDYGSKYLLNAQHYVKGYTKVALDCLRLENLIISFLAYPQYARSSSISGPLHLLSYIYRMLFPQIST